MCNPNANNRRNSPTTDFLSDENDDNDATDRIDPLHTEEPTNIPYPVHTEDRDADDTSEQIDAYMREPVIDPNDIPELYIGPSVYDVFFGLLDSATQHNHDPVRNDPSSDQTLHSSARGSAPDTTEPTDPTHPPA